MQKKVPSPNRTKQGVGLRKTMFTFDRKQSMGSLNRVTETSASRMSEVSLSIYQPTQNNYMSMVKSRERDASFKKSQMKTVPVPNKDFKYNNSFKLAENIRTTIRSPTGKVFEQRSIKKQKFESSEALHISQL